MPEYPDQAVMTRHQRFLAAVRCEPVDRVPVAAWMHLASEHLSPAMVADLHRACWQAYDWDVLKVMADYRLPIPAGAQVDSAAGLMDLLPLIERANVFEQQRACVTPLIAAVGDAVPILDSGFDPYTTLLRLLGQDQAVHLWAHSQAAQAVLQALTLRICTHLQHLKKSGVTGYFHASYGAVPLGQPRGISDAVFERFVRPYDLQILAAGDGLIRILHAHGTGLKLERLQGYPFEVLHCADQTPGNPTLKDLRQWTPKCLMGGVDERNFTDLSVGALHRQVQASITHAGRLGLIIAPGCTVAPSSSGRLLRTLRASVDASTLAAS